MRLTGGQIVGEYLARQGVPYAVGIPGHGIWTLLDALVDMQDRVKLIHVMHEQSAVHLADGYYRASGKPLMSFTSIGPGAANTIMGLATAYVDSTAVLQISGSAHTYMRGHAVLQEIERTHWTNFHRVVEPVVKRYWDVSRPDQLPYVMHRAFNTMISGRPGPVYIDLPMDVQADEADVTLPEPAQREPLGRLYPDPLLVERAAALLWGAERPCIVAGGGVISAEASPQLVQLAEYLGAPVATTWMGKGSIAEDHPLNAWSVGDTASTSGNTLAANADVVLALGCRFTDWTASSYRKGVSFSIPPAKLIHVDVDPHEIGKNYPAEIGVVSDVQAFLAQFLDALPERGAPREYRATPYFSKIQRLKTEWDLIVSEKRDSDKAPATQSRVIRDLRAVLDRSAIVTSGAGIVQAVVRQEFPVYEPRTHLTSGGYSSMGFSVPAAIGAKLARSDRQVVAVAGDGDFMQTMQEIAVAVIYDLPVVFLVLNNSGFGSIKGGQLATFGRTAVVDFVRRNDDVYSPHFAEVGRNFGLHSERVENPARIKNALQRAISSGGPALVEVMVERDFPRAGATKTGWWDVPVAAYTRGGESRRRLEEARLEEQMG
jgi:acetolactate synthase I/II/III large subunit